MDMQLIVRLMSKHIPPPLQVYEIGEIELDPHLKISTSPHGELKPV